MRSFEYEGAFLAVQPISHLRARRYGDFPHSLHSVSVVGGYVCGGYAANYLQTDGRLRAGRNDGGRLVRRRET
jgi:hypothetical protein